jgi:hypothetical protein
VKSEACTQRAGLCLLALSLSTGCDDPLSNVETIDKTRVLAARVEVAGDPTRAAPLPGEDVSVRWLVVAPELDPAIAFRFRACVASDSPYGPSACAGEPLATAESLEPVPGAPTIAFQTPVDASGDERLVVDGAVCPAGEGLGESPGLLCSDGSSAQAVTLDFAMDDGNHPNTNPALVSVSFDGSELASETGTTTDCAELPAVTAGSGEHKLRVELDASSRDPIEQVSPNDPARESLLLSYFVTRGGLDHAWSAIDSAAPGTFGSALWSVPARVDAPALARFVFVVRDGRGGSDFTERRLCIVP